jgi:hypothetical protein
MGVTDFEKPLFATEKPAIARALFETNERRESIILEFKNKYQVSSIKYQVSSIKYPRRNSSDDY